MLRWCASYQLIVSCLQIHPLLSALQICSGSLHIFSLPAVMMLPFVNRESWKYIAEERVLLPGCSGMGATSPVSASCNINDFSACAPSLTSLSWHLPQKHFMNRFPQHHGDEFPISCRGRFPASSTETVWQWLICQEDIALPSPTGSGSLNSGWGDQSAWIFLECSILAPGGEYYSIYSLFLHSFGLYFLLANPMLF